VPCLLLPSFLFLCQIDNKSSYLFVVFKFVSCLFLLRLLLNFQLICGSRDSLFRDGEILLLAALPGAIQGCKKVFDFGPVLVS
jgi:hypothetical protein